MDDFKNEFFEFKLEKLKQELINATDAKLKEAEAQNKILKDQIDHINNQLSEKPKSENDSDYDYKI